MTDLKVARFVDAWGLRRFSEAWEAFPVEERDKIPVNLGGMYICMELRSEEVMYVGVHPRCIHGRHAQHHIYRVATEWNRDMEQRRSKYLPRECVILVPMKWCTPLRLEDVESFYIDVMIPVLNRTRVAKQVLNLLNIAATYNDGVVAAVGACVADNVRGYKEKVAVLLEALFEGRNEVKYVMPLDVDIMALKTRAQRERYVLRLHRSLEKIMPIKMTSS